MPKRPLPHPAGTDAIREYMLESNEKFLRGCDNTLLSDATDSRLTNNFESAARRYVEQAILWYYHTESGAEEIMPLFQQAARAVSNFFLLRLGKPGEQVRFEWQGQSRTVPGLFKEPVGTEASFLVYGMILALLSANSEAAEVLANMPPDVHVPPDGEGIDSIFVAYLQSLIRHHDAEIRNRGDQLRQQSPLWLEAAVEEARGKGGDPTLEDDARLLDAERRLFVSLSEGAASFSGQLDTYLQLHRDFFDSDTRKRRYEISAAVCLPAWAAFVLARQMSLPAEVDNPYLPADLIEYSLRAATR